MIWILINDRRILVDLDIDRLLFVARMINDYLDIDRGLLCR